MNKLLVIFLFIIVSTVHWNSYASSTSLIKSYNSLIIKLEKQYNQQEQLFLLEKIKTKIENTLKSQKLSTKSIIVLKELKNINDRKIQDIKVLINDNKIIDKYQIEIEKQEIQKFKDYKKKAIPDYVSKIISDHIKYLNVIYNENNVFFEFLENNKIKRIIFNNYYNITESNYNSFKSKDWYIFNYNWSFVLVEQYEIEEKIAYSESYKYFKWVINNSNYYLKDWVYYYFKFDKYILIDDKYWFYKKNLKSLWLDIDNLVLFKTWTNYTFINSYTEEKLIDAEIIKQIKDKSKFLSYVYNDKKDISYDTDKYFLELKNLSTSLTNWLTNDEKIKKIYNYILDNVSYTTPIDLSKKEIFSWIHTYKNKEWVCEWYVKLMAYMLMFSWIENVETIIWFVINAPDFPNILHAWIKIGDYYYDPTFDDPIWNEKTKKYNEYIYYKLPSDLFYTNRYDFTNLPEELKTKSKNELSNIVNKNLYNLVQKYKSNWYNILKYTDLLYNSWLEYDDKISIDTLKKIITTYEINWDEMSYILNWKKIYIKKLRYYTIDEENIDKVLSTINYDFSNKYIIKWNFWNWLYEYRLAYELETQ